MWNLFLWSTNAVKRSTRCRRASTWSTPRCRLQLEPLENRDCPSGSYLLVSSFGTDSVPRYDEVSGAFVDTFVTRGSGGLTSPEGLVFGLNDHNLYVAGGFEGGPGQHKAVFRYDGTTGAFLDEFTQRGHLNIPVAVLFGPDGNLYVSDQGDGKVVRFNGTTGRFMNDFVAPGSGGLANPLGMVFGPGGKKDGKLDLYVCSYVTDSILRYDGTTGAFLGSFVPAVGGHPLDLTFGPDGNLYVTSDFHRAVFRYQGPSGPTPGALIDTFISPGSGGLISPDGLIFGPDGNGDGRQDLYVTSLKWTGGYKATNGTSTVKRYDGVTGGFIDTFVTADSGGLRGNDFLTFTETDPTTLAFTGTTHAGLTAAPSLAADRVAPQAHSVVATINGGGTALMDASVGGGISLFGLGVQLLADGSARGHFTCVDQVKDPFGGNFSGQITGWSLNADGSISLSGTGKAIDFPGGLIDAPRGIFASDLPFTVTIQQFGGPDVGHWTLDVPELWGVICVETLITGQIVMH